jgi:hypothetical protein
MDNIHFIKNEFETIKDLKNSIELVFEQLKDKIERLKSMYKKYSTNLVNTDILLTLDSFHFQTKFINIEYENYYSLFKLFINRLYGDYYKFYKFIIKYLADFSNNSKIFRETNFPVFKDLTNTEYNFDLVVDVHHEILNIVNELSSYLIIREHETKNDEIKSSYGINIDNLVSIKKFENNMLNEKIILIVNCLKSYSGFQLKFLTRFSLKLKFMYAQIFTDIKLEITNLQSTSDNVSDTILSEHEESEIMRILYDTKNSSDESTISSETTEEKEEKEETEEIEEIEEKEVQEKEVQEKEVQEKEVLVRNCLIN